LTERDQAFAINGNEAATVQHFVRRQPERSVLPIPAERPSGDSEQAKVERNAREGTRSAVEEPDE